MSSVLYKHVLESLFDMLFPARNLVSLCLKVVVPEVDEQLFVRMSGRFDRHPDERGSGGNIYVKCFPSRYLRSLVRPRSRCALSLRTRVAIQDRPAAQTTYGRNK